MRPSWPPCCPCGMPHLALRLQVLGSILAMAGMAWYATLPTKLEPKLERALANIEDGTGGASAALPKAVSLPGGMREPLLAPGYRARLGDLEVADQAHWLGQTCGRLGAQAPR